VLLDYLFLPMVTRLNGGSYLSAQFPGIPICVWIVGYIVITTLLNVLGIKVADKANVTQLVHPGGVFEDSASAASSIALQIGGQLFGAVFLAGLVVAQFASGLAAQASASRLLYAMGRDSVLPKAVFGRLNEKFHTPVAGLVVTGIVGRIAVFLDVATSTSFINFGAFTAFTFVNASVVFHYVRQRRAGHQLNPVFYVVVPVIGATICAYLLSQLDSNAITLGLSWLVLGVPVLALITRGFKAAPPEMAATEKATVEAAA
jgi:putrescine importer